MATKQCNDVIDSILPGSTVEEKTKAWVEVAEILMREIPKMTSIPDGIKEVDQKLNMFIYRCNWKSTDKNLDVFGDFTHHSNDGWDSIS